jgi:hypothetical protein
MRKMGKPANFSIVLQTSKSLLIRDDGPWNVHFTVTNDAARVVEHLASRSLLEGRRLFYFDSEREIAELVHQDGKFVRFAPAESFAWRVLQEIADEK